MPPSPLKDYEVGWRQGMLALAESLSLSRPDVGWFVPNCADGGVATLLDGRNAQERRKVRVGVFDDNVGGGGDDLEGEEEEEEKINVLQAFHSSCWCWLPLEI